MTSAKKPFTIFIEGNTASGKTSLLNYLEKFDDIFVLKEDLGYWTDFHGLNLLDLKYKNPEYYQFPFQSLATLTRLKQHLLDTKKPIKVMERSLISARHCFIKAQRDLNLLEEGMFYVLEEWHDYIDEYHDIKCDLIIYIQTDPQTSYNRIKERGRKEEEEVTLEYVKTLHDLHEKVFVKEASRLSAEVFVIDGNVQEKDMLDQYKKIENRIFNL